MKTARALLAVLLIAGCATSHSPIPLSVPLERAAQVRADCEEAAARGAQSDALPSAFQTAALAGLYFMIRGAAEGAWIGAVTGGSAADGAWIGAAAGAGLGVLIGVGVGVRKGIEAHRRYLAWYEACVTDRLNQTADAAVPEPDPAR